MCERGIDRQHGKPLWCACRAQPELREEQAGPQRVADGFVVVETPGNAGRAKEPWFKVSVRSGNSQESGDEPGTSGKG